MPKSPFSDDFVDSGTNFGSVPTITNKIINLPSGIIRLSFGFHDSGTIGFGISHIWTKHKSDIIKLNNGLSYYNIGDVPNYVSSIVKSGALIYFEGSNSRKIKIIVYSRGCGIAILQLNRPRNSNPYYTVTTAYPAQPSGNIIGTLI